MLGTTFCQFKKLPRAFMPFGSFLFLDLFQKKGGGAAINLDFVAVRFRRDFAPNQSDSTDIKGGN